MVGKMDGPQDVTCQAITVLKNESNGMHVPSRGFEPGEVVGTCYIEDLLSFDIPTTRLAKLLLLPLSSSLQTQAIRYHTFVCLVCHPAYGDVSSEIDPSIPNTTTLCASGPHSAYREATLLRSGSVHCFVVLE